MIYPQTHTHNSKVRRSPDPPRPPLGPRRGVMIGIKACHDLEILGQGKELV